MTMQTKALLCLLTFQESQRGHKFSPFPLAVGVFPVSTNKVHSCPDFLVVALTPPFCLHYQCVSLLLILHLLFCIFSLPFSALIHGSEG